MKTLATMSILAGSMLLSGAESAQAQTYRVRPTYRQVVQQPKFVSRQVVTYGDFSHVDDLAVTMEQQARDILWEMHFHYRHNPGFRTTYREAYDVLRKAKYIHQEVHHGHRSEVIRVVKQLDQLFHHVEDDIAHWQPSHGHYVGHGSLFEKMEALEDTLHHLMQDVGITSSNLEPPPPVQGNPPLPSFSSIRP